MTRWGVGVLALCAVLAAPGRAVEPAGVRMGTEPASQPASAPAAMPEPLERRAFRLTQSWVHAPIVLEAAERWDLSPFLLLALLWAESRWDCSRVNPRSGASGCGQFTRTGILGLNRIREMRGDDRMFTRAHALDPREGIHATAELLSWLTARYGVRGGVRAYNGGRHKRGFADHVLRKMRALRLAAGLPPWPDLTPPRRRLVEARS